MVALSKRLAELETEISCINKESMKLGEINMLTITGLVVDMWDLLIDAKAYVNDLNSLSQFSYLSETVTDLEDELTLKVKRLIKQIEKRLEACQKLTTIKVLSN